MARQVDGTMAILKASRVICRMVGRFGTARLTNRTNPVFAAAVEALVAACILLEAGDDYPVVRDRNPADGGTGFQNEDVGIGGIATLSGEVSDSLGLG